MATLEDIAKALGVSKSTVSKALNGAEDVSAARRRAVLEKAVEMGYSRAFRTTSAPRIAIFIINMNYENPEDFGYEIVQGFRKMAVPSGFQVEIVPLTRKLQLRVRYDEYMTLKKYCGGLFLGLSLQDPWIKDFETCRTPAVLYDNHITGNPNVTDIAVDNIEGMELAVGYLKALGHERIGYLSSALGAYVYQQRYKAYFRVMEDMGLEVTADMAASAYHIRDCLNIHLPRLLERGCTAIICSHDVMAGSVLDYCAEKGLRVPEELSVLGYDDLPLCATTHPPLTTIRQNRADLGKSAYYALSSQLNKVHPSSLQLHAELICRASCTVSPPRSE